LGAGPESIRTIVVMDSGLALCAPRNDEKKKAGIAPGLDGCVSRMLRSAKRCAADPGPSCGSRLCEAAQARRIASGTHDQPYFASARLGGLAGHDLISVS
jgi:hypothetical protein